MTNLHAWLLTLRRLPIHHTLDYRLIILITAYDL